MKTTITSMAIALLFAVTANADVIHTTDFEADGTAQGANLGILANSLSFGGGGGDHTGNDGIGLANVGNSGSFSYAVDTGSTVGGGNNGADFGWGATWGGIGADATNASGGFVSQANAGAGDKYINFADGISFTSSVAIGTDPADAASGGAVMSLRYEFLTDGTEVGRIVSAQSAPPATGWTTINHDLTVQDGVTEIFDGGGGSLGAIDLSVINGVNLVMGVDGMGFGNSDGTVLFDDLVWEVDDAFVVVAVPEPSSAVILAGLLGLCGLRRNKN